MRSRTLAISLASTLAVAGLSGLVVGTAMTGAAAAAEASVTRTFVSTGAEQSFTVPAGVTSIAIAAVGAPGVTYYNSNGTVKQQGGTGGFARGSVAVTPGQLLYVEVGSPGVDNASAFNGGGSGGGGGATDVRTSPRTETASTGTRLVVAGGGGGASNVGGSAAGGSAGVAGGSTARCTGGQPGTTTAAGAAGGPDASAGSGADGGSGNAGTSGSVGGGGGGLFGGGGGGYLFDPYATPYEYSCGGGGGSNGFGAGVTATSSGVASSVEVPSVVLTYVVPAPPAALSSVSVPSGQKGSSLIVVLGVGQNGSALHATLLLKKGKKLKPVAQLASTVPSGVNSITLKLNGRGKKALKAAKKRLKLTLVVSVVPPTGPPGLSTTKVKLKP